MSGMSFSRADDGAEQDQYFRTEKAQADRRISRPEERKPMSLSCTIEFKSDTPKGELLALLHQTLGLNFRQTAVDCRKGRPWGRTILM
jgi:hypothetical protein